MTLFSVSAFASETMTVHYVEVPVSVVGRDGNPVRGLTRANFRLFDGKRPVDVASFDAIDFSSPASLRENAKSPAAHRSFLLLFDLINARPSSLQRAQTAARTFVNTIAKPTDLIGVATLDLQRGYRLVANLTSDRAAVTEAIDHPGTFRSSDPLQIASTPGLDKRTIDQDAGLSVAETGMGLRAIQNQQDEARHIRQGEDQYVRQQIYRQIDWLSQLAASLRNLRGRPQIVLLSEGFDAHAISGRSAKEKNRSEEHTSELQSPS